MVTQGRPAGQESENNDHYSLPTGSPRRMQSRLGQFQLSESFSLQDRATSGIIFCQSITPTRNMNYTMPEQNKIQSTISGTYLGGNLLILYSGDTCKKV